jgi:hypothetical protein
MGNQDFLFDKLHGKTAHCAKWFKPGSLPKAIRPVRLSPHAVYKPLIFRNFGLGAASGRIADSHSKPRKPQAHEHHPEPQSLP